MLSLCITVIVFIVVDAGFAERKKARLRYIDSNSSLSFLCICRWVKGLKYSVIESILLSNTYFLSTLILLLWHFHSILDIAFVSWIKKKTKTLPHYSVAKIISRYFIFLQLHLFQKWVTETDREKKKENKKNDRKIDKRKRDCIFPWFKSKWNKVVRWRKINLSVFQICRQRIFFGGGRFIIAP